MIIAHRDLNAFERSLEQGCALHGRVIRRKAGGYEVLINGSKAYSNLRMLRCPGSTLGGSLFIRSLHPMTS